MSDRTRGEAAPAPGDGAEPEAGVDLGRLAVLKALGDNTRYAIYLELARSSRPLSTSDVAGVLDLHPNTVRPHLERMRDVGLLTVTSDARGGVGRPQHLYSLAPEAPSLGLEPASFPTLASMLMRLAAATGADAGDALDVGRDQGQADAQRYGASRGCLSAVVAQLDAMGFDPAVASASDVDDEGAAVELATVAFAHCPFRDLAEQRPDLLCSLHRGLIEGLVDASGEGSVVGFGSLVDRTPCQVEIRLPGAPEPV
ncbi:helix-turn-helix domain-containing protein [Iamia majanohamensis]|uniref:Helix-turn-helix domain-containing protein n=1 Tax=Iamia majanohamensis TaxID=467976 RepID=A0AAE9Y8S6_9ACTN|nr:helix-turn-helix domain-containing protein [Iamia majanohamensis]WCO66568.1 helix-turn-helix domain-containing protein [Iamia majanohamensis]